ncbi:MAG: hypothetical protein GXO61_04435 [Epsilonproteobacteria bacterium]|nr:hypothetical protein [Campylobacterota bacterium]
MGGDRIESLKKILEELFLSLELKDTQKFTLAFEKLKGFPFSSLSIEQKRDALEALKKLEKRINEEKSQILKELQEKEALLKFKFN